MVIKNATILIYVPEIETFIFPVYVYYNMKTVYSLRLDKELREEMRNITSSGMRR
nr:hypothetical protein [Saccharolobus solfataricus]